MKKTWGALGIGMGICLAMACSSNNGGDDSSPDSGQKNDAGNTDGSSNPDGSNPGSGCGQATLFAGNPFFGESDHDPNPGDDPAQRPADGANMLTGIPYRYQLMHFSGTSILTNDQHSVWRVDTGTSLLHPVAGDLTAPSELLAGPCATARFANLDGSAMGSDGTLYVADWATNAVLKITSPLDANNCTVSYFAGTSVEVDTADINNDAQAGNVGTNDGTGAAAQFYGPESMTIDGSNNLYVLDHGTAWSVRKITSGAVVSTLATFSDSVYAYAQLQFLNGKLYMWARGNDPQTDEDEGMLIALDPNAATAVKDPAPAATFKAADVGADSGAEWDIGGITTNGTKLYVTADGQIFSIDVSGTPKISASLAGQNDDTWNVQNQLDFDWTDGYDPSKPQSASKVELLALSQVNSTGVISYLSRDSSGNLYFGAESEDIYVEKIAGCP
ncbi:MAG TPA: hypothetical protein VGH28_22560 [Polyangiaceae bacterium]|jgi:hypothetical protein